MNAPTSGRRRPQSCTTTLPTVRVSTAGRIWTRSLATFMPTATLDSASSTEEGTPDLTGKQQELFA
jgi:hypothetical protein